MTRQSLDTPELRAAPYYREALPEKSSEAKATIILTMGYQLARARIHLHLT
jgi:hypothetical protein